MLNIIAIAIGSIAVIIFLLIFISVFCCLKIASKEDQKEEAEDTKLEMEKTGKMQNS